MLLEFQIIIKIPLFEISNTLVYCYAATLLFLPRIKTRKTPFYVCMCVCVCVCVHIHAGLLVSGDCVGGGHLSNS